MGPEDECKPLQWNKNNQDPGNASPINSFEKQPPVITPDFFHPAVKGALVVSVYFIVQDKELSMVEQVCYILNQPANL